MALQKTNVSLSFKDGLDTKTDPKQVVFGKLLNLLNGKFISPTRIQKRNGYAQVGPALPSNNGVDLIAYNNELVSFDGEQVYSYSTETNSQILKGNKIAVDLETTPIIRNNYYQIQPDSATHTNGLQMFVYADSQNHYTIRYSLIDTATGNFISRDVVLDTGSTAWKVKVIGNYFVVSYTDQAGTTLKYKAMNVSTPTFTISGTLVSNIVANYDVCTLGTKLYFAYVNNIGTTSMFTLDSTLVRSAITSISSATNPKMLTIYADLTLSQVWVVFQNTTNHVLYFVRDASLNSVLLIGAITTDVSLCYGITGVADNGKSYIFLDHLAATVLGGTNVSGLNNYTEILVQYNTGLPGPASAVRSLRVASKAFYYAGHAYCPCVHISEQQSTYFVVDENGSVVAKVAYGNSWYGAGALADFNTYPLFSILSETNKMSDFEFQFPYLYKDLTSAVGGHIYTQAGVNSANLVFNSLLDNKILANDIHTSGAILSIYDGANEVEHGFNLYPEGLASTGAQANGALSSGTYQYSAIYEWMDNQGNVHKSAPSTPITQKNENITFYGNTSSGSATINAVSYLRNLYVGMIVTGSGIQANSKIISFTGTQVTLDKTATSSVSGNSLVAIPNISVTASNVAGNSIGVSGKDSIVFYGELTTGNGFITCYDTQNLAVGMTLDSPQAPYLSMFNTGPAIISLIIGNQVYIGGGVTANITATNVAFTASIKIYGTSTNGSPTITATNQDYRNLVKTGDLIDTFSGGFTGTRTVLAVTATTIQLDANATANASINCYKVLPPSYFIQNGMKLTTTTSGVGGPFYVTNVVDTNSTGTIYLDSAMNATAGSITFDIATYYSSYIALPTLCITDKINVASPVIISVYRTEANGTIFYRCSSLITPIYNITNKDYIFFSDNVADHILVGNDQLYTTGGEVENIAAPATAILTSFKNRLIAVPQENKFQFWYSKQVIPGSPVEFSDVFVQNVDQRGGEITALGAMDDKLIIFKQNSIYYVVGDGPTPAGTFNDFSLPILVTADAGCVNKKSIVVMPEGLMFKSAKGIYLLSRSLELKYIGAEVEEYNSYNVTSAQLIPTVYEVRFTLTNGYCLVHDYYVDQWSVYTNISAVDSTIFQNKYTYLKSNGTILQETPGSYTDNGDFIQLSLTTSWLSFAGLQGYERFYDMLLLGDYKSPHTLNVEFAYNFDSSVTQSTQIPVTSDPGVYQYRIFPVTQKCESFRLTIYDTQDTSFGEGFDISAIIMRIGIKQGTNKMPASVAYG